MFWNIVTIVLNWLSFLQKIEAELASAKTINLFLDNDQTERATTEKIIANYDQVKNWAPVIYPDHKDFNEFVISRIQ